MRRLRWSAPVVVATILFVSTALPVGATPAIEGSSPAWAQGLLSWFLDWGRPDRVAGDASSPVGPEDPTLADSTDDPATPTSPPPDDGTEPEGAPYIDPDG